MGPREGGVRVRRRGGSSCSPFFPASKPPLLSQMKTGSGLSTGYHVPAEWFGCGAGGDGQGLCPRNGFTSRLARIIGFSAICVVSVVVALESGRRHQPSPLPSPLLTAGSLSDRGNSHVPCYSRVLYL